MPGFTTGPKRRPADGSAYGAMIVPVLKKRVDALEKAAGKYRASTQKPVLLVSMDIRRYVRRLIESKFYELPVMAYQEVTPEISVQPVARIHI